MVTAEYALDEGNAYMLFYTKRAACNTAPVVSTLATAGTPNSEPDARAMQPCQEIGMSRFACSTSMKETNSKGNISDSTMPASECESTVDTFNSPLQVSRESDDCLSLNMKSLCTSKISQIKPAALKFVANGSNIPHKQVSKETTGSFKHNVTKKCDQGKAPVKVKVAASTHFPQPTNKVSAQSSRKRALPEIIKVTEASADQDGNSKGNISDSTLTASECESTVDTFNSPLHVSRESDDCLSLNMKALKQVDVHSDVLCTSKISQIKPAALKFVANGSKIPHKPVSKETTGSFKRNVTKKCDQGKAPVKEKVASSTNFPQPTNKVSAQSSRKRALPEIIKVTEASVDQPPTARKILYRETEQPSKRRKLQAVIRSKPIASSSSKPVNDVKKGSEVNLPEILHDFGVVRKCDLTPRRRRVYDKLLVMKKNLRYYKLKSKKYREDILSLNKSKYDDFCSLLEDSLPPPMSGIIMKQVQYGGESAKESHGHRWTEAEKACLLLPYKTSPAAYACFASELKLPSSATLNRLLSQIRLSPGYNKCMFEHVGFVTSGYKFESTLIVIEFDETSIKRHLSVNLTEGQIDGYVDYGEEEGERLPEIATVAMLFLAQSLDGTWKMLLHYCYAKNATPALILKRVLVFVIRRARDNKLVVMAVSCDQGSTNRRAYRLLGATCENPMFLVDEKSVVAIFDPCHLLKGIRRGVRSNSLTVSNKKLYWKDLIQTYLYDKSQSTRLLAHLRMKKHFLFTSQQAMKVIFAVQVLGNRMSVSLKRRALQLDKSLKIRARQILELPGSKQVEASTKNKIPTMLEDRDRLLIFSDVVAKINRMFDSLNASNKKTETNALRRPVTSQSQHAQVWAESIEFLESWTFRDNQNRDIPSRKNSIWTLRAMLHLSNSLQKMNIPEFFPRSVQTDGVENYNGFLKSIAGDASPTTPCFAGAIKTSLLSNKKMPTSKYQNCEEDSAEIKSNLHFLLNSSKNDLVKEIFVAEQIKVVIPEVSSETLELSMFTCKEVLKKLLTTNVCPRCRASVSDKCRLKRGNQKLLDQLDGNTVPSMNSFPNEKFAQHFCYCSDLVTRLIPERAHRRKLFDLLTRIVNSLYTFDGMGCVTHAQTFRQRFVKLVIICCAEQYCKDVNIRLREEDERAENASEREPPDDYEPEK